MSGPENDVFEHTLSWLAEGRRAAIATVVETWGSSPRPCGSLLAVRDDGLFVGSVSGGCVEGKVVEAAGPAMANGKPCLLEFGVSNESAWDVGLACGGTVRIYLEPMADRRAVVEAVVAARAANRVAVLVTTLDGSDVRLWTKDADDADLGPELRDAVLRAVATDRAFTVHTPGGAVFVNPFNPPLRLFVVGAVHVAESLSRIASLLGYEVTLIDPREAFARRDRWPGIVVKTDWPDEVLGASNIDQRTSIVTLTHDPKIDDPALSAALRSRAFYIGALGSGKTHAARIRRLASQGFEDDVLARICGPIGLRIGARTPAEIAVSIAGQMTEALRRPIP